VLGSGLAVNLSTFAVLAIAPLALSLEDFAQLTFGVTAVMFLVSVLDLGLSITSTRYFAATKNLAFLSFSIRARLILFAALAIPTVGIGLVWEEARSYTIPLFCALALNFWMGLRAADQARESFLSYSRANLALACSRILFAGAGMLTGSWDAVLFGLFAAPVLVIAILKAREVLRLVSVDPKPASSLTTHYATFVFASSATYAALTALPIAVATWRLDPVAVGTMGIAVTFVGPLSLLNNALRLVLLPRVSASATIMRYNVSAVRWTLAIATCATVVAMAAIVAEHFYSAKYPLVGLVVAIMFSGTIVVMALGFLNLDIHRQGVPALEAAVNACRLIVAGPALWFAGISVLPLAVTAAALMMLGEATLFSAVRARGARQAASTSQ